MNQTESHFLKTLKKVMLELEYKPNSDQLGLKNAGVEIDDNGFIVVDDFMRTNINGIYAIGDVTGKLPLAHVAFDQGIVAAETIKGLDVQAA